MTASISAGAEPPRPVDRRQPDRNVFIVTLPHSGSTLLGMMLQQHPRISHSGEAFYWPLLAAEHETCSCGKHSCQQLQSIQRDILAEGHAEDVRAFAYACAVSDKLSSPAKVGHSRSLSHWFDLPSEPSCPPAVQDRAANGLAHIANVYRSRFGTAVVVDNSKYPDVGVHLRNNFGWQVIVLTRDPRGVAYSHHQAGVRNNVVRDYEHIVPVLKRFSEAACALQHRSSSSVVFVRYEDLTRTPAQTLSRIISFLGLNEDKNLCQYRNVAGHWIGGNRMQWHSAAGSVVAEDLIWKRGLPQSALRQITADGQLVENFHALGYAL